MIILGHDVNGRPLRAGDRVVYLRDPQNPHCSAKKGAVFTIRGTAGAYRSPWRGQLCQYFKVEEFPGWVFAHDGIRRIDDRTDHQPSEYTFDSLMDHLKSGVPA